MSGIVIAGNWKMNTTLREAQALARAIRRANTPAPKSLSIVLCPPFPYLAAVQKSVHQSAIEVGAQDVYHQEKGAFTGEVSPAMLAELCSWVVIGHSERRQLFGETDSAVNQKVVAALKRGLKPIICVGETRQQRSAGKAEAVVRTQVSAALKGVSSLKNIAIAYEPVWAIGSGTPARPQAAADMMGGVIQKTLGSLFTKTQAVQTSLLYGGSVTAANAGAFAREKSIHGALVGGASLDAKEFTAIVHAFVRAKKLT